MGGREGMVTDTASHFSTLRDCDGDFWVVVGPAWDGLHGWHDIRDVKEQPVTSRQVHVRAASMHAWQPIVGNQVIRSVSIIYLHSDKL